MFTKSVHKAISDQIRIYSPLFSPKAMLYRILSRALFLTRTLIRVESDYQLVIKLKEGL